MDARVTLLNVAAAEAAGMTGFSHIIVEGAASPIAKGSSEVRQGEYGSTGRGAPVEGGYSRPATVAKFPGAMDQDTFFCRWRDRPPC